MVAERGGKIILEIPDGLVPLVENVANIDGIYHRGDALPQFDVHLQPTSPNLGALPGYGTEAGMVGPKQASDRSGRESRPTRMITIAASRSPASSSCCR